MEDSDRSAGMFGNRIKITKDIMRKLSIGETLTERERFYVILTMGFFLGASSVEDRLELERAEKEWEDADG